LGIFIGQKEYWGKGYGEEACRLICRYGFDHLNLENIILRVYAYNEKAIACYKKVGFREIGKRRSAKKILRKRHDVLFMDLLPGDLN
jgi:RimJ/RimL family protein N-acetyltransferase